MLFSAQVRPGYHSVSAGSSIAFSEVVSNVGNHYDPSAFVFTCPYTGFYEFSLAVTFDQLQYGQFALIDSSQNVYLLAEADAATTVVSVANTVIVHCNAATHIQAVAYTQNVVIVGGDGMSFSAEFITSSKTVICP